MDEGILGHLRELDEAAESLLATILWNQRGYLIASINSFRGIPVAFETSSSIEYSVPTLSSLCRGTTT